jgi:O-antigen ligase
LGSIVMLHTIRRIDWLHLVFVRFRWLAVLATLILCGLLGLAGGWLVAAAGPIITVGLVVALAGGLWMLRDIEVGYWALVAVICLLPFGKLPFDIGLKPSFLDVVLGVLFVVWLVKLMVGSPRVEDHGRPAISGERGRLEAGHWAQHKSAALIGTRLGLPVMVFLLLAIMAFVAGLAHASLDRLVARHFAEIILSILLFYMVVNTIGDRFQLARLTRAIILAGFVAAVIGIVLYVLPDSLSIDLLSALGRFDYPVGSGVLRYIREDPSLPQRATGTSVDPNVLGGLLIMVGALTAPQFFARRPLFSRRLILLFGATMGLCLVLTFSRGSFVGLGGALLALAVVRYRKLGVILLVILALIWLLPVTQGYVAHFIQGLRGEDLATQMRFGEYRDALTLIQRYPVLGVGFAGSPDIDTYVSVANVYLLIAVEMGLVGLASFLIIVLMLALEAVEVWRRVPRDSEVEPLWYGYHAALLGALVGGMADHYFFNLDFHHSVTLFWLFLGLAIVVSRLVRAASSGETLQGQQVGRQVEDQQAPVT